MRVFKSGSTNLINGLLLALTLDSGLGHAQPIITTVAGMGRILTGLGGPATSVPLANPLGMAFDSKGNLYLADNQQNVVFQVTPAGVATVFAGNGLKGFTGDGGPATAAAFVGPTAIAIDAADNVYIADDNNQRIRKVNSTGIITTFAGGAAANDGTYEIPAVSGSIFEPQGLAFDSAGDLYIVESAASCLIDKVTPDGTIHHVAGVGCGFSGDGGPAANAQLLFPQGIAVDSQGNLYIADRNNHRVRKIDANGTISTFAGNGQTGYSGDGGLATSASLSLPASVAVDAGGNVYIADQYNEVIRKVNQAGIITTVAGNGTSGFSGDGGPATSASLDLPYGVAIDPAGNIYVSEQNNRRVRRVSVSGTISTVVGNGISNFAGDGGQATRAALDFPSGVKVDSLGNLFIADSMNHRVRKVTPAGTITTVAGNGTPGFSGDGGAAASAQLNTPVAVAIDSNGNIYISDQANNRVRRVTPNGVIGTYAGSGQYGYSGDGGPGISASLRFPAGLSVDTVGNLYVVDLNNNRIRKVTPAGIITTVAGTGNAAFSGDGGPATAATLNYPNDVAVDPAGNLYITDSANKVVRKVTANGIINTVAGTGVNPAQGEIEGVSATDVFLDFPCGIAVDNAGNLYVAADTYIHRINAAGVITLLVGGGLKGYQEGFDGDGGPSVAAHIDGDASPITPAYGMAVDSAGNLYFADSGNDRIRKVANPSAFPAQLVVSNPSFDWLPAPQIVPTGGDQWDFNLFPTGPNSLVLTNGGAGAMPWSATVSTLDGANWLNLSASAGNAPSTITVSANATGLEPGLYMGTVMLSAPNASNSPRYVSGTLQVDPSPFSAAASSGTLTISEPLGIGWTVTSSADWIAIPSSASGIGLGSINYAVAANTSGAQRSGSLMLENTTQGTPAFNVNQGVDVPAAIAATGGSGQSAQINVAFPAALEATVTDTAGNPVSGVAVTFSAPGTGPSGTFSGSATVSVTTNSQGVATAPAFTANGVVGTYSVAATMAGVANGASFSLSNNPVPGRLAFYPVTPCRVADTRRGQGFTGQFGPPTMTAGQTRNFIISSSACNIPATAQAYSLNVTVVPPGSLTYLTIWPTVQSRPLVSTLNSLNGAVLANAAIVPAGTGGGVSVFVTDATDLIIDIDGYFAPPAASALAFYPVTPCRVADTRNANGAFGGPSLAAGGTRSFTVPQSSCGIPATAQAYSLNMTAVPSGPLEYLSTWPTGQTQPVVSTLNALQGQIAANAAIVPAGTNGAVSVFVSNASNVVIDINGYFAPPGSPGALYFYPLTPCRIADTRTATGTFGGPSLGQGSTRSFPIPSSPCSVPAVAQAYSLNMTVVPPGSLLYLSMWPAGQTQPVVSTLNDLQGQIVANAAIVPAGTSGGVSIFVSNATNVILDLNAYFAQ